MIKLVCLISNTRFWGKEMCVRPFPFISFHFRKRLPKHLNFWSFNLERERWPSNSSRSLTKTYEILRVETNSNYCYYYLVLVITTITLLTDNKYVQRWCVWSNNYGVLCLTDGDGLIPICNITKRNVPTTFIYNLHHVRFHLHAWTWSSTTS